jgi:SSS family solute:Na+ symporter
MTEVKGVLDAWWTLAGIFGGGTPGLFLLGFFSKRTGNRAARAGVSAGVALILWMTLSPKVASVPSAWRSPFHEFLIIVFGTAAVLAIGLVAGRAASMRRRRKQVFS